MKKTSIFSLLIVFVSSLACQFLGASRPGTVVSDCSEIVSEVSALKSGTIPEHLLTTGIKRGDEFDVNQYFDALTHISMQDGYALDYVYQNDSLGGYPLLYPRPVDQTPYASTADIPANTEWPDFHEYLNVEDTEQGYFDYVVMDPPYTDLKAGVSLNVITPAACIARKKVFWVHTHWPIRSGLGLRLNRWWIGSPCSMGAPVRIVVEYLRVGHPNSCVGWPRKGRKRLNGMIGKYDWSHHVPTPPRKKMPVWQQALPHT